MKKVALVILASTLIAALVCSALGVRYSRRLLGIRPVVASSSNLPNFAWIDASKTDQGGPLFFDLHRVDSFSTEIEFPMFATTSGWSIREPGGTWAIGREAVLDFRLESVNHRTLVVNTNPTGDMFEAPQTAHVTLNGQTLGRITFTNAKPLSTLRIPAETQREGLNRLIFIFDYTVKPRERWGGNDLRPLAAWFRNITILDGSYGEISASLRTIQLFRRLFHDRMSPPVSISRKQRLVVQKAGTIITAVNPDVENQLGIEIRPGPSAEALQVTAHDLTGRSAPATLINANSGGGPASATIDLPKNFDTAFLEIEVRADQDRPIRLSAPWLTAHNLPSRTVQPQTDTIKDNPANVVVIILDAARADRFGCYGGDRPTTPHIDELAAESIVFPNVVALAPYTLCSVPTMATGLSFLEHGVVVRGQSLSQESTTLAEVLREAGYQTAAFSATPNNSKKLGLAQGFQTFVEAWRGEKRQPALDPHRLVGLAQDWLAEQSEDRPYHLMVHMVPPHEPYEPGAAFDRFSDPDYKGPADGSRTFIDLFNDDPQGLTDVDIDQTKALYDGNLLKADDAVGHLLETLRQRSDWSRTAVLVTSDHGEALGEHGRIGHNAQVYEEMIKVPFILKVPDALDSLGVDSTSQLASLADLAPTMAALAGRGFPGPITGRNLLSETPAKAGAAVIRTAHENPVYGVRSARWKLIVHGASELDLFDMSEDPEERNDCADSRKIVASGLRQILLSRLAAKPLLTAADEVVLTGQDEAMLRTLGYLE